VICDTSPIQYLHQIGLLHLLAELYSQTLIPPAVADELERGRAIGIDLPGIRTVPWLKIQAPEGLDKVPHSGGFGCRREGSPGIRNANSRRRGDPG
jgi:predicted nucleic acid-binding protein